MPEPELPKTLALGSSPNRAAIEGSALGRGHPLGTQLSKERSYRFRHFFGPVEVGRVCAGQHHQFTVPQVSGEPPRRLDKERGALATN